MVSLTVEVMDNSSVEGKLVWNCLQLISHSRIRNCISALSILFWNWAQTSLKTKVQIYHAAIYIAFMYRWESWPLWVEDVRKLELFGHWFLGIISNHICLPIAAIATIQNFPVGDKHWKTTAASVRTRSTQMQRMQSYFSVNYCTLLMIILLSDLICCPGELDSLCQS